MKIVVQVKLLPTAVQAEALSATLHACNDAAGWLSGEAFASGETSRSALQKTAYHTLKDRFGLSAQPALHVICKVADADTTLRANIRAGNLRGKRKAKAESKPISFRLDAGQPYDDRCLSWQVNAGTVSIWTTAGRMRNLRFVCSEQARTLLADHRQGESDLVYRDGVSPSATRAPSAAAENPGGSPRAADECGQPLGQFVGSALRWASGARARRW